MRYRFFTGYRLCAILVAAVLLILTVQSALRLSELACAYGSLREENSFLQDMLETRQQEILELEQVEKALGDPEALSLLGYGMGLIYPGDLVFFDGG